MADGDAKEQPNGSLDAEDVGGVEDGKQDPTLFTVLNSLIAAVFFPDPNSPTPLLQRIKSSISENVPLLREASRNTGRRVLDWARRGSPFRALLVVSVSVALLEMVKFYFLQMLRYKFAVAKLFESVLSEMVGTIGLLVLTGLLVFMLFFAAATMNAVIISLLVSLAAAGGFLALFFACVAAIYVGALTVALFAISTVTISAVIAVLTVAGWIGFFWTLWLAARKGISVAKHSVTMTGSAVSAYSTAWQARNQNISSKLD
ncbi:mucolipin-1 [Striga asiatica]|uniref:Mucolipin-1 n=1 Tax=Striga asiatica TaxID=4170 RepID=A0A5A7QPF2_STRAF|nr:mucolipin-1 [Striga asiatica]